MANVNQILVVVSMLFVGWSGLPVSESVQKPVAGARKEDIPYIKCQVCEKLASQLHQQVQKKQAQISPKKVISSSWFFMLMSSFCFFFFFLNGGLLT